MTVSTSAAASVTVPLDPQRDRLVITASALGTVFEWYDFFLYGILAALLGRLFFPADNATAATLASLAAFGAGFGVRPLGALLFGWFGDKIGRKYTFLITITLMGGSTAAIGLLPTYASVGLLAPALLLVLRLIQGLALGGEYGGAAIYVAEHAPPRKRGQYTSWIQVSVVGGFLLCLMVVLACRWSMTPEQFDNWGWRVPFLLSILLLAISLYIRLKLSESPVFRAMKEAGQLSRNPFKDSVTYPGNLKRVFIALFGVAAGLTVIYYTSQFGTLYFLQGTARVSETEALLYMAVGAFLAAPLYVGFGALSDRIGRKKLLLAGYALTMVLLFPLFHMMADGANPSLGRATREQPVTLILDGSCNYSVFAPKQTQDCARAQALLAKRGISYERVLDDANTGRAALVIGGSDVSTRSANGGRQIEGFDEAAYVAALTAAGYPDKADPAQKEHWKIILAIAVMVALSAMTYGQVAAILVELFPARIRYTSMSVPYHIGAGYFGGFLPFISQYIVVRTGDAYAGLWYTIAVVAMAFVVSAIWLPETYRNELE
jgi:MFS family permease